MNIHPRPEYLERDKVPLKLYPLRPLSTYEIGRSDALVAYVVETDDREWSVWVWNRIRDTVWGAGLLHRTKTAAVSEYIQRFAPQEATDEA